MKIDSLFKSVYSTIENNQALNNLHNKKAKSPVEQCSSGLLASCCGCYSALGFFPMVEYTNKENVQEKY